MQRHAITFGIRPGSREQVRELLANYPPPDRLTPDGTRLLSTSIFMKDDVVVRMMEIDGDLRSVMAHLAAQPGIRALERELDPYLAVPRDMTDPDGARAFFRAAMMEHVTTRVADPGAVLR